jgi:hypothetical protein
MPLPGWPSGQFSARPAPAGRADALGGVFDHGDPVAAGGSVDGVEVGGMTEQFNRGDRSNSAAGSRVGQPASLQAAVPGEEILQQVRVELPVPRIDIQGGRCPPAWRTALAVATKVHAGTITSSPGRTPASRERVS